MTHLDDAERKLRLWLHRAIVVNKQVSVEALAGELRRLTPHSRCADKSLESHVYNSINPYPSDSNGSHPSYRLLIAYRNLTRDKTPAAIYLAPLHAGVSVLPPVGATDGAKVICK